MRMVSLAMFTKLTRETVVVHLSTTHLLFPRYDSCVITLSKININPEIV